MYFREINLLILLEISRFFNLKAFLTSSFVKLWVFLRRRKSKLPVLLLPCSQRSCKFVFLLPSSIITQSFLCWTRCSKNNNAKGQNSLEEDCKWAESCFWCWAENIRIIRNNNNKRTKRSSLLYGKGMKGRTFGGNKAKRTRRVISNVPILKAANPSGRGNFAQSQSLRENVSFASFLLRESGPSCSGVNQNIPFSHY